MTPRLEDFLDFISEEHIQTQAEAMRPLREKLARFVIENPEYAGRGQNIGDWEGGEIGACTLIYPTLEEALEYEKNPW